jgi:hypothetical protein
MEDTIFNIIKYNNIIGKGSFGKIYYNPKIFPNYVVKKIKKYNNFGNNFILNNVKELWWYSLISKHDSYDNSINSNNIPKLINYHINSDNIYLLIEYKGISLYNLTKDTYTNVSNNIDKDKYIKTIKLIPMIIYTCSKIFLQLYNANMRHGDITISNIMFNKNENDEFKQISIIDWGSIVFSKLNINNCNQCALEYIAPELDKNSYEFFNNIPSIKSDIFSLGCVILYILDPLKTIKKYFDNYMKESECLDDISNLMDEMIEHIKIQHKEIINDETLSQTLDERVFYLLKKMLNINTNTRIDIESLYMDQLFDEYRKKESIFNQYHIKNILRINQPIHSDNYKNILVEETYNYLKMFKTNNLKKKYSKQFKLFDTRIILTPALQLFYKFINYYNDYSKIHQENDTNNTYKSNNINYYIISYLSCIKWIDILFNDDITIYHLFELYTHLYNLFSSIMQKSIVLDLVNFTTFFDLTFYNIFKKFYNESENIIIYPYLLDYKYVCVDYSDIKKNLLTTDVI